MSWYAPLASVERSGLVESVHLGALVVLDADGTTVAEVGDAGHVIYPRSANKPLQAAGMVALGLSVPDDELALVAASHDGEPMHVAGVRRILDRGGLADTALQNTPHWPGHEPSRVAAIRAGRPRTAITADCSGKHAGMLLTCVRNGWDVAEYLAPDHPLQQQLGAFVDEVTRGRVEHTGVDGCGAPAWAMPLRELARAFTACVRAAPGTPLRVVADAMRHFPQLVGGSSRDVTALMRAVPGLLVKEGAEAVYAAALPDGSAVALKIADGSFRPAAATVAQVLTVLGVPDSAVASVADVPVLGHGRPVGRVRIHPLTRTG